VRGAKWLTRARWLRRQRFVRLMSLSGGGHSRMSPRRKLPACPYMAAPAPRFPRGSPVIFWSLRHGAFSRTQGRHGKPLSRSQVTSRHVPPPRVRNATPRASCFFFLAVLLCRSTDGSHPNDEDDKLSSFSVDLKNSSGLLFFISPEERGRP
jgi:hypothetical protein